MSSKRLTARSGSGALPKASISTGSIDSNASCAAGLRSERALPPRQPSMRGRRAKRRRLPQRRFAPAVDQLVDLRVEFDLADAAPPPLKVEAGTEPLTLRIMIADSTRDRLHLADRAEIEAAAPDERMDGVE